MNTTLVNRFNQDFIEDSVCSSTEACRKAIIITKPNISENTKKTIRQNDTKSIKMWSI